MLGSNMCEMYDVPWYASSYTLSLFLNKNFLYLLLGTIISLSATFDSPSHSQPHSHFKQIPFHPVSMSFLLPWDLFYLYIYYNHFWSFCLFFFYSEQFNKLQNTIFIRSSYQNQCFRIMVLVHKHTNSMRQVHLLYLFRK